MEVNNLFYKLYNAQPSVQIAFVHFSILLRYLYIETSDKWLPFAIPKAPSHVERKSYMPEQTPRSPARYSVSLEAGKSRRRSGWPSPLEDSCRECRRATRGIVDRGNWTLSRC